VPAALPEGLEPQGSARTPAIRYPLAAELGNGSRPIISRNGSPRAPLRRERRRYHELFYQPNRGQPSPFKHTASRKPPAGDRPQWRPVS